LQPTPGLKNTLSLYAYSGWLFPILRWMSPNLASTLRELGLAMIHAGLRGAPQNVLAVRDIVELAKE
jgi:hypothetical protein